MKVKIFLTVLWFSVIAESVPLSDVNKNSSAYTYRGLAPKNEFVAPSLYGEPIENLGLIDDGDINYRLPNDSLPIRYDLWIQTDVDKNNFEFSGQVKIRIKIIETTQRITLHARQLTINNIDLLFVDNPLMVPDLDYEYDELVEFLIVSLPSEQAVNTEIILDITYNGTLRTDGSGFYRASYRDEANNQIWFATTQFEMTDARHAMPCYDEPGIRAVYGLEIQHDRSYNAISNMPISTRLPISGTNYVTSKFQDTIVMQSYLLAFVISDFAYKSNNDVDVEQRIYAVPQRIDRGDADFALGVVGPVLRMLEDHLQVDYPLPKMDHAAITDYIWGAMENFGLITYRDSGVLFVEGEDSISKQLSIIELIAHEYTHQFFGNVVSPKWWAYTWLNEGFATLFANYIPSLIYPENYHMERFQANAVSAAFDADSKPDVVPLNFYVQTPNDIRNKFGTVSYQKGGNVLRMFQEALTVPTFTKGLTYYLNDMYLKSATPQDLHRNLQRAYNEDFPGNGVNIDEAMTTWEEQAGYPIVNVQKIEGGYILTQQRFGGGNEVYSIPITYTTRAEPDFDNTAVRLWLDSPSTEIQTQSNDDWIILNIQNKGYYKVNYDTNSFTAIISQLKSYHETFSNDTKKQLFVNMKTSIYDGSFDAFYGILHLSYMNFETFPSIWNEAWDLIYYFYYHLFGFDRKYEAFLETIIQYNLDVLGLESRAGESSIDTEQRELMLQLSCLSFQERCFVYEFQRLAAYLASGKGAHSVCNGLKNSPSFFHQALIDKMLSMEINNRWEYVNNLGCPLNSDRINIYLHLVITVGDPKINLSGEERLAILQQTPSKSVFALEATLEFIRIYYYQIQEVNPERFYSIVSPMTQLINTDYHQGQFKKILNLALEANFMTIEEVDQVLADVNKNNEWLDRNFDTINRWFNGDPILTEPPSASTNPSVESTSPSKGSRSLVASFVVISVCVFGRMFSE